MLALKRLEGIPIVLKVGEKSFRYLNWNGDEITRQEAMYVAGGIAYYHDAADPSKSQLRHRGSFVKEEDARAIVTRYCGGNHDESKRSAKEISMIL